MTKNYKNQGKTKLDHKHSQNRYDQEIRQLINDGMDKVRETWAEFKRGELHGPYGKQQILERIYAVYCEWKRRDLAPIIRVLAEFHGESPNPPIHILNLFIRAALPQVKLPVVLTWVDALRCGEAHNVRPNKMRAFLYVKGGLVKAARYIRKRKRVAPLRDMFARIGIA